MTEFERSQKAEIVIRYICEIFKDESLDGDSRNSNFDLFLQVMHRKGLLNLKDCSAIEIGETLKATFFKEIVKLESLKIPVPSLKAFKVNKAAEELLNSKSLNNYIGELIASNDLSVAKFANIVYNVAEEYLDLTERLFVAKFIFNKRDLFNRLNMQLCENFESEKHKKKR